MIFYPHNLQPIYEVMHETQIYDVIYDDFGPQKTKKQHRYLSKSID